MDGALRRAEAMACQKGRGIVSFLRKPRAVLPAPEQRPNPGCGCSSALKTANANVSHFHAFKTGQIYSQRRCRSHLHLHLCTYIRSNTIFGLLIVVGPGPYMRIRTRKVHKTEKTPTYPRYGHTSRSFTGNNKRHGKHYDSFSLHLSN